ncbi:MAG: hypothetical protein ACR2NP_16345 [Pirellulaceae bacterium]
MKSPALTSCIDSGIDPLIRMINLFAVATTLIVACAGCQSDPYCQQAIATLRAEKIQLENEYYSLKSQYEADMRRCGQPLPADFYPNYGSGPLNEGIISPLHNNRAEPVPAGASSSGELPDPNELSSHIRSVEVHQLPTVANETARILVRPLDRSGAIIPIEGDLKIRLFDPATRTTVSEYEFDRRDVAGWVSDQPGKQPGLHVGLPENGQRVTADRLECDLQFRTSDNRILKQKTELMLTSVPATSRQPVPARRSSQPRSEPAPIMPEAIDGVEIEIGDEINFDSVQGSGSPPPPGWQPDR